MAKRTEFKSLSEEDKKIKSKECFDIAIKCKFQRSCINNLHQKDSNKYPSTEFVLDKAQFYADNYASKDEKDKYIQLKNISERDKNNNLNYYKSNTRYQEYLDDLSKIEDYQEIEDYLNGNNKYHSNISIKTLETVISDRSVIFRDYPDKIKVYKLAQEHLNYYKEQRDAQKQMSVDMQKEWTEQENLLLARITAEDYNSSGVTDYNQYCKKSGLSINVFTKRLDILKRSDPTYYENLMKQKEDKEHNYLNSIKEVVEDVIDNIVNNKEYTIIDYYLKYHDDYTFKDLYDSCNKYHLDIRSLKSFFSRVDIKSRLTRESFKELQYIYGNHVFSDEEKDQIFDYLEENKIPTNGQNISYLLTKYYKNEAEKIKE